MLCHVYAGTGIYQCFTVYPVGIDCIIPVLAGDGASAQYLGTAVTDIRSLIKAVTAFPDKVRTVLITNGAGCTLYTAEDDLVTDICLLTLITVNTEVVSIIECSFTIQKVHPVELDLLGDGCRILAEVLGHLLEGQTFIERVFNVLPVFQSQVLLVTGYVLAHRASFYCCQKVG